MAIKSWNTSKDFSRCDNPNGSWQYGYLTQLTGNFNLYDTRADIVGPALIPMNSWRDGLIGRDPNVFCNTTGVPIAAHDFVLPAYATAFHPGPKGELSVFRWTAPYDGNYQLHATFKGLGGNSTTDLHLLINGQEVLQKNLNGKGQTEQFDLTTPLTEGTTVDFAVGPQNNNFYSDTTGIDASITSL